MRRRRGGLGIGGDFGRAVWVASGESATMKNAVEPAALEGTTVRWEALAEAGMASSARHGNDVEMCVIPIVRCFFIVVARRW